MADFNPARILKGVGGQYLLAGSNGDFAMASARGLFRKDGQTPTPGDLVEAEASGDPDLPWRIKTILPRRNFLIRPTVANLDSLIITLSATDPAPDFQLADKLLTICMVHQIEPILCITKTDLPDNQADIVEHIYAKTGITIIRTNPNDLVSHERLRQLLQGRVVSFAGQSGVGKSTLLNQLFGDERMATGAVSDRIGRGRHTTRHVELFPYAGGYLADTPGFTSLELSDLGVRGQDLVAGYPELERIEGQCKFVGCRHLGELGCALNHDTIDPDRLSRYRQFREELDLIKHYNTPRGRTKR
ncbi:MAG: rsgA [Firmicutes bacterium]|nr:rsgA [Bacillota bacterium]